MKTTMLAAAVLLLINLTYSQNDCACCTDQHNKFDFWVGEWNVYDTSGTKVGENTIQKLEDNCIISEHWVGSGGLTGRSFNYFDASDSTWNQLWIDNTGSNLKLKGKAGTEVMVLQSKPMLGKKGVWYSNRITWAMNNDGSVTQIWEILDAGDQLLTVVFRGLYRRK